MLGNENATAIMPVLHTNPAIMTLASTVTDFLLLIAMGLIIGRNARVLRYYYQQKKWPNKVNMPLLFLQAA